MSFLVYQRSDPRTKDWTPLVTQQTRLRNVIQILGLNLQIEENEEVYFTLHIRPMSTPFFTSEKAASVRNVVSWKEIQPRQLPSSIRLSAVGFFVRVWKGKTINESNYGSSSITNTQNSIFKVSRNIPESISTQSIIASEPVTSWCVYLKGLHYLGSKGDWNTKHFHRNTLLFRMPFGFFTSLDSLISKPIAVHRFISIQVPSDQIRASYTLKKLAALHSVQRSVLEEISLGHDLKSRISLYGYDQNDGNTYPYSNERILNRIKEGKRRLQLREEIELMKERVSILQNEKVRRLGRVIQLKKDFYDSNDSSMDLMSRIQSLSKEMERFKDLKTLVANKKSKLSQLSSTLFRRKKELISELMLIYPLNLVEGSKKYSINEIQLPNAEDYGAETGGQLSVSLGYTAHLTSMISFFLGIPLRYPIRHFGSQSRIVDQITEAINDKEREFPLYFRNKEDVYSRYAVYLLNKNISQLRWYCGLSTPELRATLANLHNLLHDRLTIPGWPPSPIESLELAQELTEEVDHQLCSSMSLDKGLDQLGPLPSKEIENTWLCASYSDLKGKGGANNAVQSEDVLHTRAQQRFLSGWRKKTYETEEIDPKSLTNSLNLDFDAGRRLSNTSLVNNNSKPPFILIAGESHKQVRRRRYGRIENSNTILRTLSAPVTTSTFHQTTIFQQPTTFQQPIPSTEPNDNLCSIEREIGKFEKRKNSFNSSANSTPLSSAGDSPCKVSNPALNQSSSTSTTPTVTASPASDVPATSLGEIESLSNFERPGSERTTEEEFQNFSYGSPKTEDGEEYFKHSNNSSSLLHEKYNPEKLKGDTERSLESSVEETSSNTLLEPKYDGNSSDEQIQPSPSNTFLLLKAFHPDDGKFSKCSQVIEDLECNTIMQPSVTANVNQLDGVGSTPRHSIDAEGMEEIVSIASSSEDSLEINPLNLPVDFRETHESSYMMLNPKENEEISKYKFEEELDESNSEDELNNFDDEGLWLRTAALFNPQSSLNAIRRKTTDT